MCPGSTLRRHRSPQAPWIYEPHDITTVIGGQSLLANLSKQLHQGLSNIVGIFIAIPIIGIVAVWYSFRMLLSNTYRKPVKPLIYILAITLLFGVVFSTEWGRFFTEAYLSRAEIEEMGARQEVAARSRAAYPASLAVNTTGDLLTKGPVRVLYFLFAPFPWMVRDVIDLLGVLDSILYALFIVRMWQMRRITLGSYTNRSLAFVK